MLQKKSTDVFIDTLFKQSMTSYYSRNPEPGKEDCDYTDYLDYDKPSDHLYNTESDDVYI